MKTLLIVFLSVVLNITIYINGNKNLSDTLQLVHVIFRHGHRTPNLNPFSFRNTTNNETYYPYGIRGLTEIGKEQTFAFGEEIRKRYNQFLGEVYFPPDVQAFSSDFPRNQMSLQSVLTAVYPPVHPHVALPYLMWQPISYQTIPLERDNLLYISCLNLNYTSQVDPELQKLRDYVSLHSGIDMRNVLDRAKVYESILVQIENGLDVPDWTKEILDGRLQNAALTEFSDMLTNNLSQLVGGLIRKIIEDSKRKIRNELPAKIIVYSAHDMTILGLLGLFNAYSPSNKYFIEYLAHLFIELHLMDGKYGLKVFFKNGSGYDLIQLKFNLCAEDICPVDKFIESTMHVNESLLC